MFDQLIFEVHAAWRVTMETAHVSLTPISLLGIKYVILKDKHMDIKIGFILLPQGGLFINYFPRVDLMVTLPKCPR